VGVQPVKSPDHYDVANELGQAVRISKSESWKGSIFRSEKIQSINAYVLPLMKQRRSCYKKSIMYLLINLIRNTCGDTLFTAMKN
jgi:hypothetical protein